MGVRNLINIFEQKSQENEPDFNLRRTQSMRIIRPKIAKTQVYKSTDCDDVFLDENEVKTLKDSENFQELQERFFEIQKDTKNDNVPLIGIQNRIIQLLFDLNLLENDEKNILFREIKTLYIQVLKKLQDENNNNELKLEFVSSNNNQKHVLSRTLSTPSLAKINNTKVKKETSVSSIEDNGNILNKVTTLKKKYEGEETTPKFCTTWKHDLGQMPKIKLQPFCMLPAKIICENNQISAKILSEKNQISPEIVSEDTNKDIVKPNSTVDKVLQQEASTEAGKVFRLKQMFEVKEEEPQGNHKKVSRSKPFLTSFIKNDARGTKAIAKEVKIADNIVKSTSVDKENHFEENKPFINEVNTFVEINSAKETFANEDSLKENALIRDTSKEEASIQDSLKENALIEESLKENASIKDFSRENSLIEDSSNENALKESLELPERFIERRISVSDLKKKFQVVKEEETKKEVNRPKRSASFNVKSHLSKFENNHAKLEPKKSLPTDILATNGNFDTSKDDTTSSISKIKEIIKMYGNKDSCETNDKQNNKQTCQNDKKTYQNDNKTCQNDNKACQNKVIQKQISLEPSQKNEHDTYNQQITDDSCQIVQNDSSNKQVTDDAIQNGSFKQKIVDDSHLSQNDFFNDQVADNSCGIRQTDSSQDDISNNLNVSVASFENLAVDENLDDEFEKLFEKNNDYEQDNINNNNSNSGDISALLKATKAVRESTSSNDKSENN